MLTREQHKQDFNYIMSVMEVDPKDTVHELFMALIKNEIRNVMTILNMERQVLKDFS